MWMLDTEALPRAQHLRSLVSGGSSRRRGHHSMPNEQGELTTARRRPCLAGPQSVGSELASAAGQLNGIWMGRRQAVGVHGC